MLFEQAKANNRKYQKQTDMYKTKPNVKL